MSYLLYERHIRWMFIIVYNTPKMLYTRNSWVRKTWCKVVSTDWTLCVPVTYWTLCVPVTYWTLCVPVTYWTLCVTVTYWTLCVPVTYWTLCVRWPIERCVYRWPISEVDLPTSVCIGHYNKTYNKVESTDWTLMVACLKE